MGQVTNNLNPVEQRALLAELLQQKAQQQAVSAPLSYGQSALWYLHQLDANSPAYNIMFAAYVRSDVDGEALERACQSLVQRHPILRTTYGTQDGKPMQFVHPHRTLRVETIDASDWSTAQLQAALQRQADIPFDLQRGPLMRVQLFKRAGKHAGESRPTSSGTQKSNGADNSVKHPPESGVLLVTAHHIALDFWSFDLVCDELEALYRAEINGTSPALTSLAAQYVDYVRWQEELLEGEEGTRLYEYWKQQLAGDLPVLNLPTDRPRPAVQTFNGSSYRFHLPNDLTAQILAVSKQLGATPYATLLAVFKVLLYRLSGQREILVGTFTAGRSRSEFESIVGYFLNPIVLRSRLAPNMSFADLLAEVRETVVGGVAHQEFPFSLLVERFQPARDPSRSPIVQVAFGLDRPRHLHIDASHGARSAAVAEDAATLGLQPFIFGQQGAPLDLMLTVLNMGQSMSGALQYNSDLFDEATIVRFVEHYQQLMRKIAADPTQPLDELQLLTDQQQHTLLREWNQTQADFPRDLCLHQLVEAQAQRTPDAVAVTQADRRLTYRELDEQSNQLGHYLRALGVGPDQLVGICLDRSPEMLVGLLGILKAGAAYVPLATDTPAERLAFMLSESEASVVLTSSQLVDRFAARDVRVVCLDRDRRPIATHSKRQLSPVAGPENLAYVIFTSGSTGKPKGVQLEHRSVVNFLNSMQRLPGISRDDVLLAVTTLTFDISVLELFLPLTLGGQVVVVPSSVAADGQQLAATLAESRATVMQATPATWRLLIEAGWEGSDRLKVLCGGEALPRDLAAQLLPRSASLWNMYGPTETTIWSAVDRVLDETGPVPVGRPIDNTQIYILDSRLRPVPVGVTGDLYIGGDGLARGYLKRPELTAARFVPDPFRTQPRARLYKTGDLARYRADGRIEFLGREDFQVKVQGFRIELGEIETNLNQHPQVRESVVVARQVGPSADHKQLAAYFVAEQGAAPNVTELRDFLKQQLPTYMLPAVFTPLDELPLNPAGKVDRQALPAPDTTRPTLRTTYVAPRTELEEQVSEIWASVLNLDEVGVHDDYFELGGASMQSLEIATRLSELGFEVTPVLVFQNPTVEDLAAALTSQQALTAAESDVAPVEMPLLPQAHGLALAAGDVVTESEQATAGELPTEKRNTVIESLGVYLPKKEVTTEEVVKGCKKKMWFPLEKMTGIKSRRVVGEGEFAFELAREAIDECLANSKYDVDDIDLVISCSISRFDTIASLSAEPSTSMMIRKHYGFNNAIAFDITNACAGMFTAILLAEAFINTGHARRALVVSGEYVSDVIRTAQLEISGFLDSRLACLTVGDAGAALILESAPSQEVGFHELEMYTLSKYCQMCIGTITDQPHLGSILYVPDPMKHTAISVEHAVMHAKHIFEKSPWAPEDLDLVIMHQTSDRSLRDGMRAINKAFGKKLCNWDNTINNVAYRGNTASTAQFVAVWDHILSGRVKSDDNVIFGVSGSGQTIGTGIYTFDDLPDRLRQIKATGQLPAKVRQAEPPLTSQKVPRVRMSSVATLPLDEKLIHDTPKMTALAIEACLEVSPYDRRDIELLLFAGLTRTGFISEPAIATLIAGEVKMNDIIQSVKEPKTLALDVFNSSLSFFYSCHAARLLIQAGTYKTAMVASSEVNMVASLSREDPLNLHETASAVILDVSPDGSEGFGEFVFRCFPEYADARITRGVFRENKPDYFFQCDPHLVDYYLKCIPPVVEELLRREGLDISQIKAVLPSQFSRRLNQGLSDALGIGRERVVDVLVDGKDLFNNSVAYSVQKARQQGIVQSGDWGLLINVAAGIQVGCATYRF